MKNTKIQTIKLEYAKGTFIFNDIMIIGFIIKITNVIKPKIPKEDKIKSQPEPGSKIPSI
ncbi:hypothetical protein ING2E5B_0510 [Fermentimonas caenicola]|uniref:Uncharacterized protein n=1 Tax=Fermentimonas caenicola TaxID=1562970 RepID=A0A098C031_9BACT|nr:hypothetical protein ING2E5B_0510 [Fermentimonas caenicola]